MTRSPFKISPLVSSKVPCGCSRPAAYKTGSIVQPLRSANYTCAYIIKRFNLYKQTVPKLGFAYSPHLLNHHCPGESSMIDISFKVYFLAIGVLELVVLQPFFSVLIRYRANYAPRIPEVNVEAEGLPLGPSQVENGGYFEMMKRVYRIEGWAGFYKGFMPVLVNVLSSRVLTLSPWYGTLWPIPSMLVSLVVGIPYEIIRNRATVTPYRLPIFGMSTSLRALLTPYERRRLWTLYFVPRLGLALAIALQWALQSGMVSAVMRLSAESPPNIVVVLGSVILEAVFAVFSVPLQVIAIRLSVQRNLGPGGEVLALLNAAEEAEGLGLEEYSGATVNRIRSEKYTGLIDCVAKVAREEGWQTLFRAWWISVFPSLLFFLQLF